MFVIQAFYSMALDAKPELFGPFDSHTDATAYGNHLMCYTDSGVVFYHVVSVTEPTR